jgi:hypothetical protein
MTFLIATTGYEEHVTSEIRKQAMASRTSTLSFGCTDNEFNNPYAGSINLYAVTSNPRGPRSSSNVSVSMKEFGGDLVFVNKLIDTSTGFRC